MEEFLSNYGLWIALGGIFVAMHMFGMGCCGGRHDRGSKRKGESGGDHAGHDAPGPTKAGSAPASSRPGRCH